MFSISVKRSADFLFPFTIHILLLFLKELHVHPLACDPLLCFLSPIDFTLAYAVNLFCVGRRLGYIHHNLLSVKGVIPLASIVISPLTCHLDIKRVAALLDYSLILLNALILFPTLLFGPLFITMAVTLPLSLFCLIYIPTSHAVSAMPDA